MVVVVGGSLAAVVDVGWRPFGGGRAEEKRWCPFFNFDPHNVVPFPLSRVRHGGAHRWWSSVVLWQRWSTLVAAVVVVGGSLAAVVDVGWRPFGGGRAEEKRWCPFFNFDPHNVVPFPLSRVRHGGAHRWWSAVVLWPRWSTLGGGRLVVVERRKNGGVVVGGRSLAAVVDVGWRPFGGGRAEEKRWCPFFNFDPHSVVPFPLSRVRHGGAHRWWSAVVLWPRWSTLGGGRLVVVERRKNGGVVVGGRSLAAVVDVGWRPFGGGRAEEKRWCPFFNFDPHSVVPFPLSRVRHGGAHRWWSAVVLWPRWSTLGGGRLVVVERRKNGGVVVGGRSLAAVVDVGWRPFGGGRAEEKRWCPFFNFDPHSVVPFPLSRVRHGGAHRWWSAVVLWPRWSTLGGGRLVVVERRKNGGVVVGGRSLAAVVDVGWRPFGGGRAEEKRWCPFFNFDPHSVVPFPLSRVRHGGAHRWWSAVVLWPRWSTLGGGRLVVVERRKNGGVRGGRRSFFGGGGRRWYQPFGGGRADASFARATPVPSHFPFRSR
ncbi:hypothetical protein DEO72_LG9g1800 [Vigna unguiculata]|uniref:Uncharacterized protein n=1 Tax=Vigna unguiculata TaxID=3917 RepID=A0A4D6MZ95_VIGUN|nr:hypothetical protein DEO72_LG9g1800 [Vigna unguiculata]